MRYLILMLFGISLLLANGVGNSIIQENNGFVFELGKEPTQPIAKERTIFSVSIHNATTGQAIAAENIWIKISKSNQILFSSTDFHLQSDGPIFFVFSFPGGRDHSILVSFDYENKKIESEFRIKVEDPPETAPNASFLLLLVLVAALGFLVYGLLQRKSHAG